MIVHDGLALLIALGVQFVHGAHLPREVCASYNSPGDVYIGGVFSLHDDGEGAPGDGEAEGCGGHLPVSALQLVEAMVFTVRAINNDDAILPNVTLGFVIHDDCSRDKYAMWASLSLAMGARANPEVNSCEIPGITDGNKDRVVVGMVGTGMTSSSNVVASTAELFERPLVSYGATSDELLGGLAPYYFSTISSDGYKIKAIVDILKHFKWKYVALMYTTEYDMVDLAGRIWIEAEEQHASCMHVQVVVSEVPTEFELKEMVQVLQDNTRARVVVLLASSAVTANAVFSAAQRAEPPLNLTWLVSDSLVNEVTLRDGLAQGSIFVEYFKPELLEFERYFRTLTNMTNTNGETGNPWFNGFCGNSSNNCLASSEDGFSRFIPTLAPTMDAVMALAYALDKTIREMNCSGPVPDCLKGHELENTFAWNLQNVSFRGTRGDFRFYNRSVPGYFIIQNMQATDGVYEMVQIGSWSYSPVDNSTEMRLHINETLIQWHVDIDDETPFTPRSICRDVCLPGYVEEISPQKKCCWRCRPCNFDEIVEGIACRQCKQTEWPDVNQTTCDPLIPKVITWADPLVIMLVFLTSLGLLLCLLTAFGMIRQREHPLIKASSRELSCVNILGLVLTYLTVFPLLLPPGPGVCGVAQKMFSLAFTIMYAPLLLKVNRIYRIFKSSTKSAKSPRFAGPRAQLGMVAVLVLIQVLLIVITALTVPNTWTSTRNLFPTPPPSRNPLRTMETFCEFGTGFLVAMCYNALIITACCVYAYKARNVPGNYNEAKFYAVSVYTTVALSVSALPVYFTGNTAIALAVSVSLVLIMDGYVTLFLVYLPKLYAIIFKKVSDDETKDKKTLVRCGGIRLKSRLAFVSCGDTCKVSPVTI